MKHIDYQRVSDVGQAVQQLDPLHRPLAGGTDMLGLLKLGVVGPDSLIDIKTSDLSASIEEREDGLHLGALTTLTQIAQSDIIAARAPLLIEASRLAATRQIRNRATLAGNLLQMPRCWYFRDGDVDCWLKQEGSPTDRAQEDNCPAEHGRNEHHAIFQTSPCHAVHPADIAPCLLALDARFKVKGPSGMQSRPLNDLFAPPDAKHRRQTRLDPQELITGIEIPLLPTGSAGSAYVKAMDRKAWAFALASCAVSMVVRDRKVVHLRVVLGGVASIPWRLKELEHEMQGAALDPKKLEAAASRAMAAAAPLSRNAYKVELATQLVNQAVQQAHHAASAV